ncbi:DUF2577 domain-containing protein [Paenibacillus sp. P22]|uniref:DUF2577 domain-containing protein n=1 Tax=Paenibacillus sp. P22 TaxID=483908 RepID=UPI00038F3120|nr:DUF2577 domain-containing protein [Paenibacillus sp. P22]CDN43476.1 Putative uncharacterized protein [Paenibacillus sp. P22]
MPGTFEMPEGSGYAQLRAAIKHVGYNKDVDFEFGTVTAAPDIRVKLDNVPFELDDGDFDIAECLRDHTVTLRYPNGERVEVTVEAGLKLGDRVVVASYNNDQRYLILARV